MITAGGKMNFASRGTEGIRGLWDCWEAISLLSYFLTADRGTEIKTKQKKCTVTVWAQWWNHGIYTHHDDTSPHDDRVHTFPGIGRTIWKWMWTLSSEISSVTRALIQSDKFIYVDSMMVESSLNDQQRHFNFPYSTIRCDKNSLYSAVQAAKHHYWCK